MKEAPQNFLRLGAPALNRRFVTTISARAALTCRSGRAAVLSFEEGKRDRLELPGWSMEMMARWSG